MKIVFNIENIEHEVDIITRVLRCLKIEDIEIRYDEKGLVATDSWNNTWRNEEFYKFLIEEAFVYTGDNEVLGISPELYKNFMELAQIFD